ncbi:SMI1/KNR4 family protein [Nocardiopsis sp. CA-288880]|uniref:SMI1/KNR4 family protein n=1 Tax=Nocardiopsis sp. CA-288880 TaxID=3239995 RepID=UPI003D989F7B
MDPSPPRTAARWRAFLNEHSREFLDSARLRTAAAEDGDERAVSASRRENRRLGYEPAAEEAVLAAEERLGVSLPPSYRNFLLVSNGWSSLAHTFDLLPVERIGWFPEEDPQLYSWWSEPHMDHFADRLRVLERCLLISDDDGGSGGMWLLHADGVGVGGEWRAYTWWPGDGADPEPSEDFATLVVEAHRIAVGS